MPVFSSAGQAGCRRDTGMSLAPQAGDLSPHLALPRPLGSHPPSLQSTATTPSSFRIVSLLGIRCDLAFPACLLSSIYNEGARQAVPLHALRPARIAHETPSPRPTAAAAPRARRTRARTSLPPSCLSSHPTPRPTRHSPLAFPLPNRACADANCIPAPPQGFLHPAETQNRPAGGRGHAEAGGLARRSAARGREGVARAPRRRGRRARRPGVPGGGGRSPARKALVEVGLGWGASSVPVVG